MKMGGPMLYRRSSSSSGSIWNLLSRAFSSATTTAPKPAAPSRRRTAMASKLAKAQSPKHWELFKSWMSKHDKRYESDGMMLDKFRIFVDNLKIFEKLNNEISRDMIGLNRFSDDWKYIDKLNKEPRWYESLSDKDLEYGDSKEETPWYEFLCDEDYDSKENRRKPKIYDFDSGKVAEAQSSEHWEVFKSWMSKYNKNYNSDREMLYRFDIFVNNLKYIEQRNKKISTYMQDTQNMHRCADISLKEYPWSLCLAEVGG